MVMAKLALAICGGFEESVTCTVKGEEVPAVVGVPVIKPVELSAKAGLPGGKLPPVSAQVYGRWPLDAASCTPPPFGPYAVPTVPSGNDFVATDRGAGGLIVIPKVLLTDAPAESVT